MLSRLASAIVALGIIVVTALAAAPPAVAHAVLIDSTPGNWELLANPPRQVTLRFSEPVDVGLAQVRLIGPDGSEVDGVSTPRASGADAVSVTLPSLRRGTHTVSYRVVSADTHPVRGALSFSVGQVTGGASEQPTGQSGGAGTQATVLYGGTRWVTFAGLALLVGTAFFAAVCWPGGAARTGVRRLLWVGLASLGVATVGALPAYTAYTGGSLGSTLSSRMGVLLLVRLGMLALLSAALYYLGRRAPTTEYPASAAARAGAVLAVGTALALTVSLGNHSATGGQVALAVPMDTVHLLAMAVWLGGLVALLAVLLRSGDVLGMRVAMPRFSRLALVCVAVLTATGAYQAWRQVGSPSALLSTTYGGVLVTKIGVIAVLLAFGLLARNWVRGHYAFAVVTISDKRRARRGPAEQEIRRFRRLVAVETTLAAVVLGVTASLVSVEPARAELERVRAAPTVPQRTGPVNEIVPFDAGGERGRGRLAVTVTPGAVGRNEVHLSVLDPAGRPMDVEQLSAELSLADGSVGPLPVELRYFSPGHFIAAAATVPMPGQWELAVAVRTSEVDQDVVRIPVGAR
ncbi:putative copper export protein [Saccharomonospora marina XMU15]|uniref:Putative copper export protein n=1 Tax=Saccharomonospora marina XMU15 TaxID=882083 RepID=H5X8Z8_9PSEU|nr:copper resistance protein CopC [Saccharomonospora marina]EHR53601.1 putative copper export protein [Saccharomonospora marina XMU15]